MKVPSNKIGDIRTYYIQQLSGMMTTQESRFHVDELISHFADIPRFQIPIKLNQRVGESLMLKIHFAVKDLLKQRPLQYILGETDFFDLKFKLNEHVLIPRPETEELVSKIINDNKMQESSLKILDVGTGSGCIAVSLAANLNAEVYAVDYSQKVLEIASLNAVQNGFDIHFMQLDILQKLTHDVIPMDLDLIVSNPPYVREQEKKKMQKNVLDYEPEQALFVDDNHALVFYEAISEMAATHLKQNGKLWFEINEYLAEETKLLVHKYFKNVQVQKDYKDCNRFIKAWNE